MAKRKWHGDFWTLRKEEILALYAPKFLRLMRKRQFRTMFVDACAGTGYIERWNPKKRMSAWLLETPSNVSDGSARRALSLNTPFDKYVLIEIDRTRFKRLREVRADFPLVADRISLRRWDANNYLPKLCGKMDWSAWRAVVFLDPPGAQIKWETVKAIAETKAADVWYLFPLGQTVNRLLTRDRAKMENWQKQALDVMFGATDWYEKFYRCVNIGGFNPKEKAVKRVGWKEITDYFVDRLKTLFPHVLRPYRLYNRAGVPLFALYFASPNRRRAEIAMQILSRPGSLILE